MTTSSLNLSDRPRFLVKIKQKMDLKIMQNSELNHSKKFPNRAEAKSDLLEFIFGFVESKIQS